MISQITSLFESTSGELGMYMQLEWLYENMTLAIQSTAGNFLYVLILSFWWQAGEQDGQEREEEVSALLHWGGQGG